MNKDLYLKWIHELQAISQIGLTYTQDPFDKQRYLAIQSLSAEMAEHCSELSQEKILKLFSQESGYCTPKLDVRGVVFRDNKILMVREREDNLWTLPGGWADVNESPSEAVVREIFEESGYKTQAIKLLALYDKQKHDHPPQWPHAYKCFFLCDLIAGKPQLNIEISEIQFFGQHELPELSKHRITEAQILRFFAHFANSTWPTDFD